MTLFIYKFEFILHNTQTEVHKSDSITVSQGLHCLLSIGFEFILFWETIFILGPKEYLYYSLHTSTLHIYSDNIFLYIEMANLKRDYESGWGGGGTQQCHPADTVDIQLIEIKINFCTFIFFIFMHYT